MSEQQIFVAGGKGGGNEIEANVRPTTVRAIAFAWTDFPPSLIVAINAEMYFGGSKPFAWGIV